MEWHHVSSLNKIGRPNLTYVPKWAVIMCMFCFSRVTTTSMVITFPGYHSVVEFWYECSNVIILKNVSLVLAELDS